MLSAPRVRTLVAQGSAVLRRPLHASSASYQIRSSHRVTSRGVAVDNVPSARLRSWTTPPSLTKPTATAESGPFLRGVCLRDVRLRHVSEQRRFNNYYPRRGPGKPPMSGTRQREDDWLDPKPLIGTFALRSESGTTKAENR